ncbi:MAG TPA: PPA1309 family protein [Actinophytocola sp.]|uniref:PPA1309 family protein n=1 Tax=Actinophytocola sp. TaxID=1872138 RepID=UPI002DB659A0|nr:PPA1309 family protein [Actinophytocola sp.]HEU5472547.1 PPA1309 family protein [Actinophytocola sp.]
MPTTTPDDLRAVAREVEDFVASGGWDQGPQLFALVPTAELLAKQPELAGTLDENAAITPVAQDALPDSDLADALAGIVWPDAVHGCALAHEILVLPPQAEAGLPAGTEPMRRAAAEHPERREARMVAAVLRDGSSACVLRLRGEQDELVESPDLAPNLIRALLATLRP